ncbi:MAG: hypothetical protein V4750_08390, partial [Pseudomonadota bacterium]
MRDAHVALLLGRQRRSDQKFGGPQHAIHRRADLVAGDGKELRLRAIGLLGLAARRIQFEFLLLQRDGLLLQSVDQG